MPKQLCLKNELSVSELSDLSYGLPAPKTTTLLAGNKRGVKKRETTQYLAHLGKEIEKREKDIEGGTDKGELKKKRSQKQACKQRMKQRLRTEKHTEHLEIILEFFPSYMRDVVRDKCFNMEISDSEFERLCRL